MCVGTRYTLSRSSVDDWFLVHNTRSHVTMVILYCVVGALRLLGHVLGGRGKHAESWLGLSPLLALPLASCPLTVLVKPGSIRLRKRCQGKNTTLTSAESVLQCLSQLDQAEKQRILVFPLVFSVLVWWLLRTDLLSSDNRLITNLLNNELIRVGRGRQEYYCTLS